MGITEQILAIFDRHGSGAYFGESVSMTEHALQAAHFNVRLVVVNYYSLDYSNQAGTDGTRALNEAVTGHAEADGAIVADAFTAFQQAAASAGGKTCAAGLLNTTPGNQATCDVHPSQSGQQLLAQAVVDAVNGATGS